MELVQACAKLEIPVDGEQILKNIEAIGRTAYQSGDKITEMSCDQFVKHIMDLGHLSVIEHEKVTIRIICDRGVSHEIVRHRLASYTQESTRYCNYSKDKFGNVIKVIDIVPGFNWDLESKRDANLYDEWVEAMDDAERHYMNMLELGASPQEARSVLPNSLKTEIVITMNLREWRHFCAMRVDSHAHPQMREVATEVLKILHDNIRIVFDDLYEELI